MSSRVNSDYSQSGARSTTPNARHDADDHTPLLQRVLPNHHQNSSDGGHHFLPNGLGDHHALNPSKYTNDERPVVRGLAVCADLTWRTLRSNYVNILLVFVPLGIIAGALDWSPTAVFLLNFFAIIPLASLLSFATEELSAKLGETLGGLLNATFGNAVELIVSIIALKDGEIRIVQSSMLGSVLSNMLLVLGCCFVAGGIHQQLPSFNETVASTMSSMMLVASASLILPATLYAVTSSEPENGRQANVMILSRGTSIILLSLYILYLFFQLYSHANIFNSSGPQSQDRGSEAEQGHAGSQDAAHNDSGNAQDGSDDEEEEHILGTPAATVALVVVTIAVAVCAEYLVGSIDSIVSSTGISKTFIGLILLPIVGNAAEHVTAVVVSVKGKMDLAMGVAVGSSLQIALLVTPFLVILGWIIGQPMSLHFETFETVVFFLSVLVVNYLIQDSRSNYLEGAMLLGVYIIIAIAFYIYPDEAASAPQSLLDFQSPIV